MIALIATLMLFSFSYKSFMGRAVVRAELERMRAACLYLQRRALQSGVQQELRIDHARKTYFCGNERNALAHGVAFGSLPGVQGPPSAPRALISRPITFQNDRIVFHPDGTILPGTVYLVDTDHVCLYALSSGIGSAWDIHTYQYANRWRILE